MIMAKKMNEQLIDMGKVESEKFEPTEDVRNEFDDAAQLGSAGQLIEKLREPPPTSPARSGGDVDEAREDAGVGEKSVDGGKSPPDQDVVEKPGKPAKPFYGDGEPQLL
jgi:hypothetical protein